MSIAAILLEVAEDICNNYCKYNQTCDEDAMCEVIREGGTCPLDKLT